MRNKTHNILWQYKNFPKQLNSSESVQFILRSNISTITNKLNLGFLITLIILILRFSIYNLIDSMVWIYFLDTVLYGFLSTYLVYIAYYFHNYYLSFFVITNQRIIIFDQQSLVFADVRIILLSQIEKIEVIKSSANHVISNIGNLVLYLNTKNIHEKPKFEMGEVNTPENIKIQLDSLISNLIKK